MTKKFSIITVTKNNRSGLERTLESVKKQICCDYELIVVDGHSGDGTDQLLLQYQDVVSRVLQDKGVGIYAAMNQGICKSTGDWLIFMNAGDCFYDERVLERFPKHLDACFAYGKTWFRCVTGSVLHTPQPLFWQGMPSAHQSMFFRNILFEKKKYDTNLDIAADFEFFMSVRQSGGEIYNLNTDVSLIERGGISDVKIAKRVWQTYRIAVSYVPKYKVHLFYTYRLLRAIKQQVVKSILSEKTS